MGMMCLIFLVCSLRTNFCFVMIFLGLLLTFIFLTVAYWLLAADYAGNAGRANKMIVVSTTILRVWLAMTDNMNFIGRRRFCIRDLCLWLVDLCGYYACCFELPVPNTCWRLEPADQTSKRVFKA